TMDCRSTTACRTAIRTPTRTRRRPDGLWSGPSGASVSLTVSSRCKLASRGLLGKMTGCCSRPSCELRRMGRGLHLLPTFGRAAGCSGEWACVYGPVMVLAQYYREWRVLRAPAGGGLRAADVDLNARGFYVLTTCLLTGEERTSVSQAIIPLSPFEPHSGLYGLGAWELLGRVSQLEFDSDDPAAIRLVDPARSAERATEFLAGVNWYVNQFVRFQFSWEYARFSNRVRLGPGTAGLLDHQNSFIVRTQIIF